MVWYPFEAGWHPFEGHFRSLVSLHGARPACDSGPVKGPVKRDKRLSVRVPEDVLKRLRVVAMADGRSLADWAFRAVERELERAEARLARQRPKPQH